MMTWLKMTLAFVAAVATLIEGGMPAFAISQITTGEELSPNKIFQKVQNVYASLSSYSDEGKIVGTVNGVTLITTFTIKLARPNFYRIEWKQQTPFANLGGVVWSAGDGDFMVSGNLVARKEANQKMALANATGVSGGAAATIGLNIF